MTTSIVDIQAGSKNYPVMIGSSLLGALGDAIARMQPSPPTRVLLVADDSLPASTVDTARASLASACNEVFIASCHATEENKSIAAFEKLHAAAASQGIDRGDCLVALGGGITGDLVGFVAATHRRGVRVIQCPTTLLAMVDASVGGKTGINLVAQSMLLKNFVGNFHQPECVLASIDTLDSLDDRQFRSGLGECIKHAMISGSTDPQLGDWTRINLAAILNRNTRALAELIERNVRVKAAVVATDERETAKTGGRALLNLGHTFAHAIETIPTLSPDDESSNAPLLHGEAVALGLVAAVSTARSLDLVDNALFDQTLRTIQESGLPTQISGLPSNESIVDRMAHDKKALGGSMRFVLPVGPGSAKTVLTPPLNAVKKGLDAIRSEI